jgi:hypothetical protein
MGKLLIHKELRSDVDVDVATRSGACCAVDFLPEYEGLGPEYIYEAEGFVLKRFKDFKDFKDFDFPPPIYYI